MYNSGCYIEFIGKVNKKKTALGYYTSRQDGTYGLYMEMKEIRELLEDDDYFEKRLKEIVVEEAKKKAEYLAELEKKAKALYPDDFRLKIIIRLLNRGAVIVNYDQEYVKDIWPELDLPSYDDNGFIICVTDRAKKEFEGQTLYSGYFDYHYKKPYCYMGALRYSSKSDLKRIEPFKAIMRDYYDNKLSHIPYLPYDLQDMTFTQAKEVDQAIKKWHGWLQPSIWRIKKPKDEDSEFVALLGSDEDQY